MIEERYRELMNLDIDGVISQEEKNELDRYLDRNPEARRYFEELRALTDLLDSHEHIEPPEAFDEEISGHIFRDRGTTEQPHRDTGRGWRFGRRPALSFITGLAAGLVIFALVYFVTEWGAITDYDRLYGTIGRAADEAGILDLDAAGIEGTLRLYRSEGRLIAHVSLRSEEEITMNIRHGASISLDGFRISGGTGARVESFPDRVELRGGPGRSGYIVVFDGDEGSPIGISVTLLSKDSVLFEGSITAGRAQRD